VQQSLDEITIPVLQLLCKAATGCRYIFKRSGVGLYKVGVRQIKIVANKGKYRDKTAYINSFKSGEYNINNRRKVAYRFLIKV